MAANYFLFAAQHTAIITTIILADRVWYVFRVSATTSSPMEDLEATDEDRQSWGVVVVMRPPGLLASEQN